MTSSQLNYLKDRCSVRNFTEREVEEDKFEEIIKSGQRAPSAGNMQPYSFIVIQGQEKRERLYELSEKQNWVKEAPLLIYICVDLRRDKRFTEYFGGEWADYEGVGRLLFPIIDASLAAQNMVTAAEMLGLGSVFVGTPSEHPREVEDLLSLPKGVYPLVLLCIGYPEEEPDKTYKWNSSTVVHYDEYEELKEKYIEDYAETIEEFTGLDIEEYMEKIQEHYDPEELKESFERMNRYFEE
ncbi:MAG: nitroreductase family protein [Candidatus Thermoplasmatota archaeon]|nr:nitroreductase family protein [Candidatus Thermoplasmatota archaeon]